MKKIKKYLRAHPQVKSGLDTFVSTFILTALPLVGTMSLDKAALYGLLGVCIRAAWKAVTERYIREKQLDIETEEYQNSKETVV